MFSLGSILPYHIRHHIDPVRVFFRTVAQYSEWTVGPLCRATCSPMFMQFTGCHQPVQRFYWPENAMTG